MLQLNTISFKDSKTGKTIEVSTNGKVNSSDKITPDEYAIASFYAGIIFGGGYKALLEYLRLKK